MLRSYPHWRNVSKSRRDRLLHQSPLSRIPEFPRFKKDLKAYLKEFYSTAPERVKVMTIREKCFTKATLAKIGHLATVKEIFVTLSQTYVRMDRYLEEILVPI